MRQKNLLWIVVIFLLLLNSGILIFLLRERSPTHSARPHGFDEQVIRTLHLDSDQQMQFEQLKRRHHEQIMHIDESMHQLFVHYFSLLQGDTLIQPRKDSLEHLLAAAYAQKVQITYAHFHDLKAICKPDQQAHFAELLPELMQVISPPQEKKMYVPEGN